MTKKWWAISVVERTEKYKGMQTTAKKLFVIALFPTVFCAQLSAAPVELNLPSAHIIVVRPVDAWSGDKSVSDDTLQSIKLRRASYMFGTEDGSFYRGSPTVFQGVSDYPVTKGVEAEMLILKMKLVNSDINGFTVQKAVSVPASDMATFIKAQADLYKRLVIAQGNPETLSGKVSNKKLIGGLLAVGATVLSMDKFGAAIGSQVTLGSGITNDIYRVSYANKEAIVPAKIPTFDFTAYKSVDVRKVTAASDRVGQVIIAYKEGKTPEAEQDAIIRAIVSLTGADTTPEEVEKSRADDLANRLTIWNTCLADPTCKHD